MKFHKKFLISFTKRKKANETKEMLNKRRDDQVYDELSY